MEDFIYENDVNGMRARDLRNLLVQKLGVSQDLVNRVLDRNELKEMVTSIVYKKLQDKDHDAMMQKVYIATFVVGVVTVLYMCRRFIHAAVRLLYSTLSELSYKSAHKLKLIVFNAQNKKLAPALALTISILLEVLATLVQFTIFLGWIVPHGHVLRKYFIPTFSFPVSAGALLKAGTGGQKATKRSASVSNNTEGSGGIGEAVSNFSLDIGPMITIAVLNFVINRLDEYAAGVVLENNSKSKDEKKAFKKFFGGKKKPHKEKESDRTGDVYAGDTSRSQEYVYGDEKFMHSARHDEHAHDNRSEATNTADTRAGAGASASAGGDEGDAGCTDHSHAHTHSPMDENKLGNSDGFDLNILTSAERPAYVNEHTSNNNNSDGAYVSSKENDGEGWLD